MSDLYEKYIENVEDSGLDDDTSNAAADALAFVVTLHDMFKENGVNLPEDPDTSALESVLDGMVGELSAACLFLSEDSFEAVPDMLRGISSKLSTEDTYKFVPTVITKGFSRLANRIEATRVQQEQWQPQEATTS